MACCQDEIETFPCWRRCFWFTLRCCSTCFLMMTYFFQVTVCAVQTQIVMNFDTDPTSLYSVKGIVILDQDGNRIIAKYFDKETFGSVKEQKAFEKNLYSKTSRNSTSEILLLDGVTCLYRSNVDLYMYVLGCSRENELILEALLNCLYDSISTVLRKNVEKKTLIDAMDTVMLIIDEICDEGIILETDSQAVVQRCHLKGDEISFSDQTFSQVGQTFIGAAKEQFKWSLLK